MRKITCLIVDDEPLALDLIESYVKRTPFLELVGRCSSPFEAMEVLDTQKVDLMFLDIQMPELNGLEFSRTLSNSDVRIVFTTAFEQYALDGFKVDALDYLLKPFNYEEFLKAANKAKDWFALVDKGQQVSAGDNNDFIFVKSGYKLVKIKINDILYFEGVKDYVKIHLQSQPTKPIMSLMSLKSLEEQMSEKKFMRIHRSFIVNLDSIEAIERGQVLINKVSITVADNYKDRFNEYLAAKSMHFN